MVDNYSATLLALSAFILANAPPGAERELAAIRYDLDHPGNGRERNYFNLEFRNSENSDSCALYVDVRSDNGYDDEEGNRWHEYAVQARVSWPSYGSDDVATCQRRLALMALVTRFAAEVQAAFPGTYRHLAATKAQREESARTLKERTSRARVENMIRANSKNLRVGQQRRVEVEGDDILPVGQVTVESPEGRKYTTHVTSTRAFYFTRVA